MTHRTISRVVLGAVLATAAGGALAQAIDPERAQKMAAELQKRFAAADTNGDGRLTKEEAKGKMPMVYKNFEAIDAARAGSVSRGDIAAYVGNRRSKRNTAR